MHTIVLCIQRVALSQVLQQWVRDWRQDSALVDVQQLDQVGIGDSPERSDNQFKLESVYCAAAVLQSTDLTDLQMFEALRPCPSLYLWICLYKISSLLVDSEKKRLLYNYGIDIMYIQTFVENWQRCKIVKCIHEHVEYTPQLPMVYTSQDE